MIGTRGTRGDEGGIGPGEQAEERELGRYLVRGKKKGLLFTCFVKGGFFFLSRCIAFFLPVHHVFAILLFDSRYFLPYRHTHLLLFSAYVLLFSVLCSSGCSLFFIFFISVVLPSLGVLFLSSLTFYFISFHFWEGKKYYILHFCY